MWSLVRQRMTSDVLKSYWDTCQGTSAVAWLMPLRQTPAPGVDGHGYLQRVSGDGSERCGVWVLGGVCVPRDCLLLKDAKSMSRCGYSLVMIATVPQQLFCLNSPAKWSHGSFFLKHLGPSVRGVKTVHQLSLFYLGSVAMTWTSRSWCVAAGMWENITCYLNR